MIGCSAVVKGDSFTNVPHYHIQDQSTLKMYRTESEHDLKSLMKKKWGLVIMDLICFLTAMAIFSVCIWIRFDLDFAEWVVEIDW